MDDEKRNLLIFGLIIVIAASLMLLGIFKSSTM